MKYFKVFGIDIEKGKFQETAIYVLARIYSLLEKEISNYLRPFGLTPAKFNAMMVIKHKGKDKGISQVEIGRQLIVTASNMTRLLDRLDKEGFIERMAEGEDRRVNLIRISKKGSDILDRVWPGYYKKINVLAQVLETKDLEQISSFLIKWCIGLEGNIATAKYKDKINKSDV